MKTYLKITAAAAMFWVIPMAFLGEVSVQPILHETIRNLYWHVTMWFAMFLLLLASVVHGIVFLRNNNRIKTISKKDLKISFLKILLNNSPKQIKIAIEKIVLFQKAILRFYAKILFHLKEFHKGYFIVSIFFKIISFLPRKLSNGLKDVAHFLGLIQSKEEIYIRDEKSLALTQVALLYGCIGIVTGMIWARFTWDTFWTKDPQLNGAAITILAYLAYLVLRASIPDARKRAEISAVYGIFAFVLMVVLIVVLPRMQDVDSLHPGKGGNPGFGNYKDLKNDMRLVFYPAILAWTLVGFWLANLSFRIQHLTRISHVQP